MKAQQLEAIAQHHSAGSIACLTIKPRTNLKDCLGAIASTVMFERDRITNVIPKFSGPGFHSSQ
ncbi:MAG: hypothetical protein F6K09_06635 [Merismopedia sp. SIO2A8]|nr:hypothetical protein [Merismopedia sp. SIO2A8]